MLGVKLLKEVNSSINGKIEVISFLGKPRIIVGNMLQSGGLIESIWNKAIKRIKNCELRIKNVLILGLGGGTAAQLVSKNFPQTKIIGVEIDPIMIKLGKKYFNLDKIKNLKIICTDAITAVKTPRRWPNGLLRGGGEKENLFDLILVDLYLGNKFPKEAESQIFLKNLRKLLAKDGIVIFNRLFYGKQKKYAENFVKKLDQYFSKIELTRAWSNLLVVCRI